MKTIKNKLTIVKAFSILLLFVFFVGLQIPLFSQTRVEDNGRNATTQEVDRAKAEVLGAVERLLSPDAVLVKDIKTPSSEKVYRTVTLEMLEKMEIQVVVDAALTPSNLIKIQDINANCVDSEHPYLYVMDENGKIYINPEDKVNSPIFGHPAFFNSGRPVAGAGEIYIKDGIIQWISNASGHYQPDGTLLLQVVAQLHKLGITYSFPIHLITKQKITFNSTDVTPE